MFSIFYCSMSSFDADWEMSLWMDGPGEEREEKLDKSFVCATNGLKLSKNHFFVSLYSHLAYKTIWRWVLGTYEEKKSKQRELSQLSLSLWSPEHTFNSFHSADTQHREEAFFSVWCAHQRPSVERKYILWREEEETVYKKWVRDKK